VNTQQTQVKEQELQIRNTFFLSIYKCTLWVTSSNVPYQHHFPAKKRLWDQGAWESSGHSRSKDYCPKRT